MSAIFQPAGQSLVFFSGDLGYSFIPTKKADLSLSRLSLGGGAGLNFGLISDLSLFAHTKAGYYYGFLNDGSGTSAGNPFVSAGLGLAYQLTKRISLGIETSYNSFLDFYNNWTISLGTSFRLSPGAGYTAEEEADNKVASLAIKAAPKLEIPAAADKDLYKIGGGLELSALIRPAALPLFYLSGNMGYGLIRSEADLSISRLSIGAGPGMNLELMPGLSLHGYARGGYYYGFLNDGSGTAGSSPYVSSGVGLSYLLTPRLSVEVEGSYNIYHDLLNSWGISLGTAFNFSPTAPPPAEEGEGLPVRAQPLFYDTAHTSAASFTLRATPNIEIPVGADMDLFNPGGGLELSGIIQNPNFPLLYVSGDLGYGFLPTDADLSLSRLSVGGGAGLNFELIRNLSLDVNTKIGYYYGFLNDGSGTGGGDAFISSGIGLGYSLTPSISLGIEASYSNYLNLCNNWGIAVGTALQISRGAERPAPKRPAKPVKPEPLVKKKEFEKGKGLEITDIQFYNVFPIFFKYYDENPVGKITLHNWERDPMEDIKLTFFVKQYMDNPKPSEMPARIEPGEEKEVDFYGLFTNKLLEISEGSKVSTLITLSYTLKGKEKTIEHIETMRVHGRNFMTWDDDRKASSFVTAKDATVLRFAKNIAGIIRGRGSRAINQNMQVAMGMHEALSLYGMKYVIDPTTPYAEFSRDTAAIDFLQFPKQSLEFKAGDCDDLSILYCALLEAVGVETAFITVPGHIFMAFSLDMDPDAARKSFLRPDDLIFEHDKSWIPIEVTEVEGGFLNAWQAAAKQWREHRSRDQAGFYSIHQSWQIYEPTGYPGETVPLNMPSEERVVSAFQKELVRFTDREIFSKVSRLQEEIRNSQNDPRYINRLAVLYARYGLDDRAEKEFSRILAQHEYIPALVNLGNIYYLKKDMTKALSYYERAQRRSPNNAKVLLAVARVHHELENYGMTRQSYGKLKEIDPDLATQFAYLDLRGEEAVRAAEISKIKEIVIWDEE